MYAPTLRLQERGNYLGMVHESSFYTKAGLHPAVTRTLVLGAGIAALALLAGSASPRNGKA